jgi:hypothetical protein
MWMNHYKDLYNSVDDSQSKNLVCQRIESMTQKHNVLPCFSVLNIFDACRRQKCGKAVGSDGISMEAFIYGGTRLYVHISLLFNLFLKFSFLPTAFMKSIIIPLVKCKSGDLADVNNYRAIAVSTALSKLLENVLASFVQSANDVDAYQFGFTAGHSTSLCTSVFKRTVDYYRNLGSHVFVCFIDFTKAFDLISYWKLLDKLLDDDCNPAVIKLLAFWYCHQCACVRWHNVTSQFFGLGNGTRQGGVLSPKLFARYIRELLTDIVNSGVGCNVGGVMLNVLAYADDIVLLAPSWRGLQCLLDLLTNHASKINMVINTSKSVCMVFFPSNPSKIVAKSFPQFHVGLVTLQFVSSFKYLGHRISANGSDDDDIQREICNMFMRVNVLIRRFCKCSVAVKCVLFKSFCLCLYDAALWSKYSVGKLNKLRSCYNKCIKIFFWVSEK